MVEGGVLSGGADTACLEPLVCLSLCHTLLKAADNDRIKPVGFCNASLAPIPILCPVSPVVQAACDSLRPCICSPGKSRHSLLGLLHAQVLLQSWEMAKAHTWEELSHSMRDSLAPRCC